VSKDVPPVPRKGTFTINTVNEDVRARLPEYLTASGDPVNNALIEALGADWHFGQVAPFPRAGHIPHSILLPSADFFNPDKTFKSADEIRPIWASGRNSRSTHCGAGGASGPFFAFRILKYPKVSSSRNPSWDGCPMKNSLLDV
jgi:3-mercaptopyruvate sulfurtransferase SseA